MISSAIGGDPMPDVLVRDIPDDVVAAIDARAARLGLSRNEYLRRRLYQDAQVTGDQTVRAGDLRAFADRFADLADPLVMRDAWS
jgi:plasmid stability protein